MGGGGGGEVEMEELVERLRDRILLDIFANQSNNDGDGGRRGEGQPLPPESNRQIRLLKGALLQLQKECQFYGIISDLPPDFPHHNSLDDGGGERVEQAGLSGPRLTRAPCESDLPTKHDKHLTTVALSKQDVEMEHGEGEGEESRLEEDSGNTSETISISSQDWQHLD